VVEKNYLPADPADRAQVRAAVTRFAERAWRRAAAGKSTNLLELLDGEIKAGETVRAALRSTMVAVLCSKDFLHLVRVAPERQGNRLTLSSWPAPFLPLGARCRTTRSSPPRAMVRSCAARCSKRSFTG
jgi:hypothetical protein